MAEWRCFENIAQKCIDINLGSTPVDSYNNVAGWSEDNLDRKSNIFIPKKVRTKAEKLFEFYFNLKDCPFCGDGIGVSLCEFINGVKCVICSVSVTGNSPEQAIKKWNTRPKPVRNLPKPAKVTDKARKAAAREAKAWRSEVSKKVKAVEDITPTDAKKPVK